MPYANGKIYRTATEGIVNDLTGDIQKALGTSETDLGSLCRHDNITMWAKHKPVRHSTLGILTLEQLRSTNCGLQFTRYTSPVACLNAAIALGANTLAWSYNKPRGMAGIYNEPYRQVDFDGYDRNEICPFREMRLYPENSYYIDLVQFQEYQSAPKTNDAIQNEDLGTTLATLTNVYVGFICREKNVSTGERYITMDRCTQPSTGAWWLPSTFMSVGKEYDCAFFFSGESLDSRDDIARTNTFFLLPYPYVSASKNSQFGIEINAGRGVWVGSQLLFGQMTSTTMGVNRIVKNVKVCLRKAGNYTPIGNGLYTITPNPSAVLADGEEDIELFNGGAILLKNGAFYNATYQEFPVDASFSTTNYISGMSNFFVQFTFTNAAGADHIYTRQMSALIPVSK